MAIQKITAKIIADGAIIAADVADGSITNAKIDSVANTKITGLVTASQIANVANTQVTGSIEATQVGTTVSQLFGMRNRIINGDMRIDQRNAGASVTIGAGASYTLDRWQPNSSQASKFSVQQNAGSVTPPNGFTNYLGVTSLSSYSVPSGEVFDLRQLIEGFNVADLGWGTANAKTVTLSFWVRSSLTGTFGGSIFNSAANRSYPFTYTISSANTWEQKTVTIAGDTSGTWLTNNGIGLVVVFGLGVGSTYSGTAGAWAGATYTSATGATSVVGTNGATFYITGVQLEVGSTATPFERRLYNQELANCQRYYVKYAFPVATGVGASTLGNAVTETLADGYIIPSVPFRVSASSLSLTVSSLQVYTVSSGGTFSSGTWAIPYDTNSLLIPIRYTHGSSVFTSGASQLIVGIGTTGFLALSAEL